MDNDDALGAARGVFIWAIIMCAIWSAVAAAWMYFSTAAHGAETTYGRMAAMECPPFHEPYRRNLRHAPVCAQSI